MSTEDIQMIDLHQSSGTIADNGTADTGGLKREIDEAVYALYGVTLEEIRIVVSASANPIACKEGGFSYCG
jgi:hypothetical protein